MSLSRLDMGFNGFKAALCSCNANSVVSCDAESHALVDDLRRFSRPSRRKAEGARYIGASLFIHCRANYRYREIFVTKRIYSEVEEPAAACSMQARSRVQNVQHSSWWSVSRSGSAFREGQGTGHQSPRQLKSVQIEFGCS